MYWKLKTTRGFTYPSSIYNIPVVLWKTTQERLLGMARIKWYTPNAKADRIYIFENTFEKWIDYVYKVIRHEHSHFIYHRNFSKNIKEYWENLSNFIPEYITEYASTQPAEDFAELVWYSYYKNNNLELPSKCKWSKEIEFKYKIANNLLKSRLK